MIVDRHLPAGFLARSLQADALRGLTSEPKWLPPKWLYDKAGSALFEEITRLPEYYPTRTEREILHAHARRIAELTRAESLVELGSGSSEKTRLLLDGLRATGTLRRYVPVDVSESALLEAGNALVVEYPGLEVHAVLADFECHLDLLPRTGRRLVAFLGGTIGNLGPVQRVGFLRAVRCGMRAGDALLLGADLVKSPGALVPAYDDAAGVTAAFNRNVLHVLNRELGADFDVEAFGHVALWDETNAWIEMRLRASRAMRVRVAALDLAVDFAAGEEMRTEISAKFRRAGLQAELAAAGLELTQWWTDTRTRFALTLAVPTTL